MSSNAPQIIDVPFVPVLPERTDRRLDVRATFHFLLTRLIADRARLLFADFNSASRGKWQLRSYTADGMADVVIFDPPDPPHGAPFRSLLAYAGHHFMNGQLYGGYAETILRHNGKTYQGFFYTGNDSLRGHWLRLTVRPYDLPPASPAPRADSAST